MKWMTLKIIIALCIIVLFLGAEVTAIYYAFRISKHRYLRGFLLFNFATYLTWTFWELCDFVSRINQMYEFPLVFDDELEMGWKLVLVSFICGLFFGLLGLVATWLYPNSETKKEEKEESGM